MHLSELQKIVVDKQNQSSVVDLLLSSSIIKKGLILKKGLGLRMFLLSKDKSFINCIVDENGRVDKKG